MTNDSGQKTKEKTSFLLELYKKALNIDENKLYEYFLDHAIEVTESRIGFFHFVNNDQKTIKLTLWNKKTLQNCSAHYDTHYPMEQAGNWADSIRKKHAIIYNDFKVSPNQKGLPKGHVPLERLVSYPILEKGKVYAIFGVGNKKKRYDEGDIAKLELVGNELNKILKQKRAETELKKLNRTLRAMSNSSQALTRAADEESFLQEICRIINIDCGYKMVWVGLTQKDSAKSVLPVAYAGFEEGYLDSLKITWADTPRGRGPTGRAIRTGQPQLCINILTDPTLKPWRKEALKRGYASSIALPLKSGDIVFGALTLYSAEKDFCSDDEVKLLTELASDFARGIMILRLKAEKDRAQAEVSNQAALIDLSPDGIFVRNLEGTIIFWSKGAEKLYGWSKKEALGQNASELLKTKFPEPYKQIVSKLKQNNTWSGDLFHTTKNGRKLTVQSCWKPKLNYKGKITEIMESNVDITERIKAEDALKKAKVDWERTFDSVPDLIAILDNNHKILRANKSMAQALKTTPEQAIGLNCYTCVHGANEPPEFCPHAKSLLDEKEHTAEVHEDRLGGDFLVSTTPLKDEFGRMIGSVHVARDITERKRAEDARRKSEEKYRSYIEVTGELGWTTNAKGEVVEDIPTFRNYTGLSFDEVKGWGWSRAIHPEDLERTTKVWKKAVENKNNYEIEYRLRRRDGVYRHFLARGAPLFNESGDVIDWVGTCIDITKRKEMEDELLETLKASQSRQSEVAALLEASKAVLVHREFGKASKVIFDCCKNLLGASAGYVALLSQDQKENQVLFLDAGGRPCTVDPALPMPIRGLRASSYLTGKVTYDNDFVNSRWVDLMPRGHVVLNNVMFAPLIIDRKTVGIIGLANKSIPFTERDAQMATAFGEIASIALINSQTLERLSENEKLLKTHSENLEQMVEEKTRQLRDSERLATIGATAGMVGHDIRNPLQAIISDLYLAKEELVFCPDSENKTAIKESLSEIEKNADYINKIVADLQDFARPLNPSIQKMDLQSVCSDILSKANIPKNIKLSCTISENASELVADENWVKRILFNLVNNAVQAMPTGGDLTILGIREGSDLIISVQDTGLGIPEDVKSKLFIPLFTTKSKGQGFGLAVIKRLTEALNGKVTFNSIMGKGTKFNIILPAPSGELTKTASETKG